MNMKIENIIPYKIAYIRYIGPYGSNNVQTMNKIKKWAESNDLFTKHCIILGIAQDNPENTVPEHCRYDACIVISDNFQTKDEENISFGIVSGGNYAVFTIEHTEEALEKAWWEIFVALANQGYETDEERPIFERYSFELVANHYCEICVPVR